MLRIITAALCLMAAFQSSVTAQNVFDPGDGIVEYDASKPPKADFNAMSKWVKGKKASFNSNKYKSYIFNNMAFRLRYPNGYDPKDKQKTYPVILFMHGAGEVDSKYINEYNIAIGGEIFEKKIDSGLFNAFLLFPQAEAPGWEAYYPTINKVLDSLEKYCNTDPDRLITMGISMGGLAAVQYSMQYPHRSAIAIGSSPALIHVLSSRVKEFIHVPIWLGYGTLDVNPSVGEVETFANAFANNGGFIRHNSFPVGHGSWFEHWLGQPIVQNWNNTHKANPLVYYNQNQVQKGQAVNVRLGLTPGFAAYEWQKNNLTIPGATGNEIVATSLGTYQARFKRTSASKWSEWSPSPAVITGPAEDPAPPTASGGLTYKYYEGDWESLPDFNTLKPIKTGTSSTLDLGVRKVDDYFGLVWEGSITLPVAGDYTFELASDDGSKFYFDGKFSSSAKPLINNDGLHDHLTPVKGTVKNARAGTYPFALSYFEKWGHENLYLYWTGPNFSRQLVPPAAFGGGQSLMAVSPGITGTGTSLMMDAEATLSETGGRIKLGSAYPNPFTNRFTIDYTNAKANGRVEVQVFDLGGRLVTKKHFGQLPAGTTQLNMSVNGEETRKSVYLARVSVDGIPVKLIKVVRHVK